jgi:hypothetical protein
MKETSNNPEEINYFSPDRLTIGELRSFSGFENMSDEEALKTVTSLCQLSQVAFQVFVEEQEYKSSENDKS